MSIQRELRRIRQLTLPSISRVLAISDFIRRTQSIPDRGNSKGVRTILLGADHMALGTFGGNTQEGDSQDLVRCLERYVEAGQQLLMALGRFEAEGYKNSPAVYEIFGMVRNQVATVRLLLLDAGEDCGVPQHLAPNVDLLGAPDDITLQRIMHLCTAGISTSYWEGFNLPLAEMQWLCKPAVAFNVGAHPEVIAEPWLLGEDNQQIAAKVVTLLKNDGAPRLEERFAAFRERRRWKFTLEAWESEILDAVDKCSSTRNPAGHQPVESRIVMVDVTNASLDPANPGVIRVVRRLSSELQHDDRLELVFAAWSADRGEYVFLDQTRRNFLEGYGGPRDGLGLLAAWKGDMTPEHLVRRVTVGRSRPPVVLLPEVMFDGQAGARLRWVRSRGYRSAGILYDLIPIYHPELCDPSVREGFPAYLRAIAELDALWSISEFTLSEFSRYAGETQLKLPGIHEAVLLPGQFGRVARTSRREEAEAGAREIRILFVSTLEPRKNHKRLLQAFQMLRERRPNLRLRLVIIGNRYAGAPEIAEQVQAAARRDPCIEWLGTVDDYRLAVEFRRCAFTVYPSVVEGYGLPILESLWMGRPCLAHYGGVMRELAEPGGCLTIDMTNPVAIADALESFATDSALLERLYAEALARKISTWSEYAGAIAGRLQEL
jgi:glycosyltransferase involved in cell wall biosynthesis